MMQKTFVGACMFRHSAQSCRLFECVLEENQTALCAFWEIAGCCRKDVLVGINNLELHMKELVARFKALDTTCVSDALDKLGIVGGVYGVKPLLSGKKICGTAFTVRYVPCRPVKGNVGDFLDDVKPGEVVVIDNGGRDYCTVWGDIMAVFAKKTGIEGTVIDGVCRDVPVIKEIEYPMFTKGYYMVTGKDRVEVESVNATVSLSGVSVAPGDIILGDDSGVVVIPRPRAEDVLKIAEQINETENAILKAIENNSTLKAAREKAGYHHLQTKSVKGAEV